MPTTQPPNIKQNRKEGRDGATGPSVVTGGSTGAVAITKDSRWVPTKLNINSSFGPAAPAQLVNQGTKKHKSTQGPSATVHDSSNCHLRNGTHITCPSAVKKTYKLWDVHTTENSVYKLYFN